jgi:hypothetical protein
LPGRVESQEGLKLRLNFSAIFFTTTGSVESQEGLKRTMAQWDLVTDRIVESQEGLKQDGGVAAGIRQADFTL